MQGHSVSLRFRSTEQCTFDREETRELESRTKHIQEKTSIFGDIFSCTTQKTTVTNKVLWPSLHARKHCRACALGCSERTPMVPVANTSTGTRSYAYALCTGTGVD